METAERKAWLYPIRLLVQDKAIETYAPAIYVQFEERAAFKDWCDGRQRYFFRRNDCDFVAARVTELILGNFNFTLEIEFEAVRGGAA